MDSNKLFSFLLREENNGYPCTFVFARVCMNVCMSAKTSVPVHNQLFSRQHPHVADRLGLEPFGLHASSPHHPLKPSDTHQLCPYKSSYVISFFINRIESYTSKLQRLVKSTTHLNIHKVYSSKYTAGTNLQCEEYVNGFWILWLCFYFKF